MYSCSSSGRNDNHFESFLFLFSVDFGSLLVNSESWDS